MSPPPLIIIGTAAWVLTDLFADAETAERKENNFLLPALESHHFGVGVGQTAVVDETRH